MRPASRPRGLAGPLARCDAAAGASRQGVTEETPQYHAVTAVEHTLQMAIQAALDVASHIVSDRRLGEPRTNRELFDLLPRDGWLDASLTHTLRNMAGVRNVLVHGYDDVDLGVVKDVLAHHLNDLSAFVVAVRERLALGPGAV